MNSVPPETSARNQARSAKRESRQRSPPRYRPNSQTPRSPNPGRSSANLDWDESRKNSPPNASTPSPRFGSSERARRGSSASSTGGVSFGGGEVSRSLVGGRWRRPSRRGGSLSWPG